MSERKIILYLQDIFQSIEKIEKYIHGITFETFSADEKTIDAVIRNIEIIGEAVKYIPQGTIDSYPEIPWKKIVGMRNKAIHEYFGIDIEILWQTITHDLSDLKIQIKTLLEKK